MEARPYALLLKYPGTNCDSETARALECVGFEPRVVPITRASRELLAEARLVVLSGGFSYGDYVMAGRFARLETTLRLGDAIGEFVAAGGFVLGICNGFQILMELGLLPEGSLIDNSSGRFQCRWVGLEKSCEDSPYLTGLPEKFELPIAHAEGRFVTANSRADEYVARGLVALRYRDDINGSEARIAGLQDVTRRVFGLMPHPERFLFADQHYDREWKRSASSGWGWGYHFFKSLHSAIVGTEIMAAT